VIPWELVSTARVPGADGELKLYRRGDEFAIRIGGAELMNSEVHASEDALAEAACERLPDRTRPRILVGGLGMGFTVATALRQLGARAKVVVAELVPAVIEWNHGPLGHLAGYPLRDRRVEVREGDVALLLRNGGGQYDAILLDVDNGPDGLTTRANDRLYSDKGLQVAWSALRPDGVLAVWSVSPDNAFAKRLRRTGFEVEEVRVRARGTHGGGRRTIWVAQRGE
jgi:spermidine synthase